VSLKRQQLAENMRRWQRSHIHAALTEMPPKQNKTACRMFRNVMGFMGDRTYESPLILAEELLAQCLENLWLRDEVYIQILKQVTGNQNPESSAKGWQLLACCLETFPPQSEFENFLEMYLRTYAKPAERYVKILHATVYGGPRATAPNQAEITKVINGETLRKQAFEKKKEYKKPIAQIPPKAPIGAPPVKGSYLMATVPPTPTGSSSPSSPFSSSSPTPTGVSALLMPNTAAKPPSALGAASTPRTTQSSPLRPSAAASFNPAPSPRPAATSYAAPNNFQPPTLAPVPQTPPVFAPPPPPPSEWQTAYHPQTGVPYYYNTRSGEVTWDKPADLM